MNEKNVGRILMADDERSFLKSTTALLRREGYECDGVGDAPSAVEKLRAAQYDLLIADIKMPGNVDLDLIKQVPQLAPGMPVIMVTGYPSLESATQSIELPVVAYLVKPVPFDELLRQARLAIECAQTYRAIAPGRAASREAGQDWRLELNNIRHMLSQTSGDQPFSGIDAFMTQTFRMIVTYLAELKSMVEILAQRHLEKDAGLQSGSPKHLEWLDAIFETIAVLERNKNACKAEGFDALRLKLKRIVKG
jgi:DNA-binding response OmpR family regulator